MVYQNYAITNKPILIYPHQISPDYIPPIYRSTQIFQYISPHLGPPNPPSPTFPRHRCVTRTHRSRHRWLRWLCAFRQCLAA